MPQPPQPPKMLLSHKFSALFQTCSKAELFLGRAYEISYSYNFTFSCFWL
ncbi:MAG: hypothetical protein ACI88A_001762, partial [Paraglaciecola sp.]